MAELWAAVRDVATRHVAEVTVVLSGEYLGERDAVEMLSAAELEERIEQGKVVVLDVRPEAEYRAGHITGALSAPSTGWRRLRPNCRNGVRSSPIAAVRTACTPTTPCGCCGRAGLRARRLDVGFPEWRRAGLPVELAS